MVKRMGPTEMPPIFEQLGFEFAPEAEPNWMASWLLHDQTELWFNAEHWPHKAVLCSAINEKAELDGLMDIPYSVPRQWQWYLE